MRKETGQYRPRKKAVDDSYLRLQAQRSESHAKHWTTTLEVNLNTTIGLHREGQKKMSRKKNIRLIQDMCQGCRTIVRAAGDVGLHQYWPLGPYLFLVLIDVWTEYARKDYMDKLCLQMTMWK